MKKLEEINAYYEELKTVYKIKQKQLFKKKKGFLQIEKYKCFLNNGKTMIREKVLKNNQDGNAAIVLPITEDGRYILAIEPRVFTEKTVDIGLPAGYIEKDESPDKAVIRELEEETGYTSSELEFIGSYYQDQGCSGACNYYYIAKNCKKVGNQNLDESEFIHYILVTEEELDEIINQDLIKGLNTAFVLERAKNNRKR